MADGFGAFREALSAFLEANQFLGLALYVGIEEVGVPFPVPADTLIVLMGYQVSRGEANPLLVLAVTVGSATLGGGYPVLAGTLLRHAVDQPVPRRLSPQPRTPAAC